MTVDEIISFQKEFDSAHESRFPWNSRIDENNLASLEFLLISLTGELGETSNIVKKIIRGDFTLDEKRADISEEIVDMFIYLIKLSYQLDIDLEATYLDKMEKNRERFKKYER